MEIISIQYRLYNVKICFLKEHINLEDKESSENSIPSPSQSMDQSAPDEPHPLPSDLVHTADDEVDVSDENFTRTISLSASEEQKTCFTVQPNRILCGVSTHDTYGVKPKV